jgi:hypothetical protein
MVKLHPASVAVAARAVARLRALAAQFSPIPHQGIENPCVGGSMPAQVTKI